MMGASMCAYKLTKREVTALNRIEEENNYLNGEFATEASFAPDIGKVTLSRLEGLGLIESGPCRWPEGETGYRTTLDAQRCLLGGFTWEEVLGPKYEDMQIVAPRVKTWPVTVVGSFRKNKTGKTR